MWKDGNPKKQKAMLEVKNTATEIKNASDGLINRQDTTEKRIFELEDVCISRILGN